MPYWADRRAQSGAITRVKAQIWREVLRVRYHSKRARAFGSPEATVDRKVKSIKKDRNGNITALCNAEESWSPRLKADVVKDITENKKSYYVQQVARRSYVRVASGNALITTSDAKSQNHLDRLPES